MKVNIKKLRSSAKVPTKAHKSDAGMDLYVSRCAIENGLFVCHSDIAFEIPEGYVGLVFARSSVSNMGLVVANSVGVIDSGYRGEVSVRFKVDGWFRRYMVGDKFAQMVIMPYPEVEFNVVDELSESDSGEGGYGSTGR